MSHMFLLVGMLAATGVCFAQPTTQQAASQPSPKLRTPWAAKVDRANPWPEYPRPQLVRERWLNLNGEWQWEPAAKGYFATNDRRTRSAACGRELPRRIIVPFPVEAALSGIGEPADGMHYRRMFELPAAWNGDRIWLHFGAVDWNASVYVNGTLIGRHRGGYDAFSFDITNVLRSAGMQEIVVDVNDPTDRGDQPRGKQVCDPNGIWYTPASGIWQTVWIEPRPAEHIEDVMITPDVDQGALLVKLAVSEQNPYDDVQVKALRDGDLVATVVGTPRDELKVEIPQPRTWSPNDPFLYDLQIDLRRDGQALDTVKSYAGLRKISLMRDSAGVQRIALNNQPIFLAGPLDQGYWPDGIYTAPTDEALRYDIEMTKKLGFNMTRKHVKVEPARWYYWCDKLGLLVWQDMPSGDNKSDLGKRQFQTELKRMIESHRNHPSIMMWVVFNEGWGQFETERMTAFAAGLDTTRLINNASGWTDAKVGDVIDVHNYPAPSCPPREDRRAAVLGEFGGLGLASADHMWKPDFWGYRTLPSSERLTREYERLWQKVYELRDSAGLAAAVYTQLTDVEIECNGLLTYDRAVVKGDLDRLSRAARGDFSLAPPPPTMKPIVATAEKEPANWQFTTNNPPDGWTSATFDDSGWTSSEAGFGTTGTPGAQVRTEWRSGDIWLRRVFELRNPLSAEARGRIFLRMHHDEDAEVYLNGVLAARASGYTTEYEEFAIAADALKTLQLGRNSLAVHCRQTTGGQYIDVGIVEVIP